MKVLRRLTASVCALTVLTASLPAVAAADPAASAVTTEEALGTADVRSRVDQLLARTEVQEALAARGVDPAEVKRRVQAMTDAEAQLLAERIDTLPAGGDVLGVLFAIFIILLITDILGLTKVFPFTRPVR